MWVYTCCLLLVSTYMYSYGLGFILFFYNCCLTWFTPFVGELKVESWQTQTKCTDKQPADHMGEKKKSKFS